MNDYPIVFTIDHNYVLPLCVALVSLFNSNVNENIKVYILSDDLSNDDKGNIKKSIKKFKREVEFITIDGTIYSDFKTGNHFTNAIYFRFLIPEIFKNKYEKVLYIDSDTLILDDLTNLFRIDISNFYLGAVEHVEFDRFESLNLNQSKGYFVSGTILFNIKRWNDNDINLKLINFLKENDSVSMPDQDALNVVINGEWKHLDLRYAILTSLLDAIDNNFLLEYKKSVESPIIVHFSGSSKPWHFINRHKYKKEFNKFLKVTPFYPYIPEDFTFKNTLLKYMPSNLIKKLVALKSQLFNALALMAKPKLLKMMLSISFEGYLKEIGWVNSFQKNEPIDNSNVPLPWLTYPFIDFIDERLNNTMDIFEYGSGNSTCYYAKKVNSVTSVEHGKKWYEKVKNNLPKNVSLYYKELVHGGEYSMFSSSLEQKFDIIIVDGRDRVNSIINSIDSLAEGGVIILDDSERKSYRKGIDFLLEADFKKIDFWGISPGIFYKKNTTIFYKTNNCLGI